MLILKSGLDLFKGLILTGAGRLEELHVNSTKDVNLQTTFFHLRMWGISLNFGENLAKARHTAVHRQA